MSTDQYVAIAGIVIATAAAVVGTGYRIWSGRRFNLRRRWSILQSLADEVRTNWLLIRIGAEKPVHETWTAVVRDRHWIPLNENGDYYDLLSLYSHLIAAAQTASSGAPKTEKCQFQNLEPWIAAWWAHLQSEANRWRDRIDKQRRGVDRWLWLKSLISLAPEPAEGPACWSGFFGSQAVENLPSQDPDDVKREILGQIRRKTS